MNKTLALLAVLGLVAAPAFANETVKTDAKATTAAEGTIAVEKETSKEVKAATKEISKDAKEATQEASKDAKHLGDKAPAAGKTAEKTVKKTTESKEEVKEETK